MAKVYQYYADGYEAGETEDYGLQPSNSTYEPMPPPKAGHVRRWVGSEWIYVEDHKGEQGYKEGKPFTIAEYGPYPESWSYTPPQPTPEEELVHIKAKKIARLDEIDRASIRPARAIAAGSATEEDNTHLLALENEANILRIELSMLTVGAV